MLVTQTIRPCGLAFGSGKGGQQHRRENSDDSDNDEQFNQSEGAKRTTDTSPRLVSYFHINPGRYQVTGVF
jgi:hypothetical protein